MVKKIGGWSRLREQRVQRAGGRRLLCVCAKFVGYDLASCALPVDLTD